MLFQSDCNPSIDRHGRHSHTLRCASNSGDLRVVSRQNIAENTVSRRPSSIYILSAYRLPWSHRTERLAWKKRVYCSWFLRQTATRQKQPVPDGAYFDRKRDLFNGFDFRQVLLESSKKRERNNIRTLYSIVAGEWVAVLLSPVLKRHQKILYKSFVSSCLIKHEREISRRRLPQCRKLRSIQVLKRFSSNFLERKEDWLRTGMVGREDGRKSF